MQANHVDLDGACRLDEWGLMRASGADAATFLHSQLTSDVSRLDAGQARLAGYCSPKGRLLASFVLWRDPAGDLLLACSADLLPATLKRLRMFVLRAKCVLSDASAELALHGVAGASASRWLAGAAPWTSVTRDGATAIALPAADGVARALLASSNAPDAPPLAPDAWRRLEVRSGVARIVAATAEQFVPQMLNYELLGGVDFQKGCYPGQEVVARSQFRGSVKRRSLLFEVDVSAQAGQAVFGSDDPAQPAGMVVNAAPLAAAGAGGSVALVETKLAALGGELRLASADGPPLRRIAMPYDVPVETSTVA